nr:hypothetical protein [Tanacetum cinerariifolium]
MVLERLSQPIAQPIADPLALLSNVSNTQHGLPSSSTLSITPVTSPRANLTDDLIENLTSTLALLTQSYRTFLPQTNNQLRTSSNPMNQATVQDGRIVVQNVQGRPNRGQGMNPWGGNAAGYGEAQNRVRNVNQGQARPGQARTNSEYFKDKMLLMQAQENGVALDAKQQLFLAGGPNNAFDDDYVKEIDVSVIHNNASSVPNDTSMMIYDDMCESIAPSVSNSSRNAVVKNSLTAELATYREQVELHERRAKFELNEHEQKINEQLRLVISDRNFKEETLKWELHSIKLQLTSTINQDTLEILEITRKKMNAKMTDPECVTHKVKIAPHDSSQFNRAPLHCPHYLLQLLLPFGTTHNLCKCCYDLLNDTQLDTQLSLQGCGRTKGNVPEYNEIHSFVK